MARQSRLSHLSDAELSNMTAKEVAIQFYAGNIGAGYNALVARGIKPRAQDAAKNGDSAIKTVSARVATLSPIKPAITPVLALPGRIEDYLLDNILPDSWDEEKAIPQHFVEMVVLSDTVDWNKRIRRLGSEEIEMLEAFLGNACTMNRREDADIAKRARAPFERSDATIAHHARIDASLASSENRFNDMRYDAAIVAGYLGE